MFKFDGSVSYLGEDIEAWVLDVHEKDDYAYALYQKYYDPENAKCHKPAAHVSYKIVADEKGVRLFRDLEKSPRKEPAQKNTNTKRPITTKKSTIKRENVQRGTYQESDDDCNDQSPISQKDAENLAKKLNGNTAGMHKPKGKRKNRR